MLLALVVGVVAGFVLAIPPGPIAVSLIKQSLEGHARNGLKMATGAAAMDILYAAIAAFASSALVSTLKDKITGNPWLLLGFQVVAIVVLVVLGIKYLKPSPDAMKVDERKEMAQEKRAEKMGYSSPYLVGVLIALTNLASPTFLPSFIFVIGLLHARDWVGPGAVDSITYAVGFGVGAVLWFFLLVEIITRLRDKLSKNFTRIIFMIAAGSFLIFAVILAYTVITTTQWSKLPGL